MSKDIWIFSQGYSIIGSVGHVNKLQSEQNFKCTILNHKSRENTGKFEYEKQVLKSMRDIWWF